MGYLRDKLRVTLFTVGFFINCKILIVSLYFVFFYSRNYYILHTPVLKLLNRSENLLTPNVIKLSYFTKMQSNLLI